MSMGLRVTEKSSSGWGTKKRLGDSGAGVVMFHSYLLSRAETGSTVVRVVSIKGGTGVKFAKRLEMSTVTGLERLGSSPTE